MTSPAQCHLRTRIYRRAQTLIFFACISLFAQTRLDFPQQVKGLPSVVMIQRAVCVQPPPGNPSDCTGLELYNLLFADGTQKILVGIPDDGTISKDAKWTPVPITPPGTSTAVGMGQIRLK